MSHIFDVKFINPGTNFILASGTTNAIPRLGEKVRFASESDKAFTVTDVIYVIGAGPKEYQEVEIQLEIK